MFKLFLYLAALLTIIPTHIYSAQAQCPSDKELRRFVYSLKPKDSNWETTNREFFSLRHAINRGDTNAITHIFTHSETASCLAALIAIEYKGRIQDRKVIGSLMPYTRRLREAYADYTSYASITMETGPLNYDGIKLEPLVGVDGRLLDKHGHLLG
jgi:hypothetical protein